VLFGNSDPVIGNPYDYLVFYQVFHTYFGSSIGMAVFNRVHQEVTDHLLYLFPIGIHINGFGIFHVESEGDLFLSRLHLQEIKGILNKLDDIKIFPFHFQLTGFELGDKI